MSNVSISDLPSAPALGGTELVEIVQAGASFKTTTGDIADVRVITTNDITDMTVFGKGVAMAPSLSNVLDNNIGADQGTLIYRGAASWGALGPGTLGQVLQTRGASQDPVWAATTGVGTVVQVNTGAGLTGGPITSSGTVAVATNGVTYGLLQQVAASSLVGNATGVLANATGITLDSSLTFSGSALAIAPVTATGGTTAIGLATRFGREFTPEDFGAVGDGTTDDKAAIQAAITYIGGIGGGTLHFRRAATYMVSARINHASGVNLIGTTGATLKATAGNVDTIKLFSAANKTGFRVEGMTFDGNAANIGTDVSVLTQVFNCQYWSWVDNTLQNTKSLALNLSTNIQYAKIHNNRFSEIAYSASPKQSIALTELVAGNSHNMSIMNNTFYHCGLDCISLGKAARSIVAFNRCTESYALLYTVGTTSDMIITGNVAVSNQNPGAVSLPNGIDLLDLFDSIVSDNVTRDCLGGGIGVFDGCGRVTVTGNMCINNNRATSAHPAGIVIKSPSDRISLSGNICTDTQGSKTQTYGVVIDSTATNVFLDSSNILTGNAVNDIAEIDYSGGGSGVLVTTYAQPHAPREHVGYIAGRYYTPPGIMHAVSTGQTADRIYVIPLVVYDQMTMDQLAIRIETGIIATNAKLAIYRNTAGRPAEKIAEGTSSVSGAVATTVTAALSPSITLRQGSYWLATLVDGALVARSASGTSSTENGAQMGSATAANVLNGTTVAGLVATQAYASGMPANLTSAVWSDVTTTVCPIVAFRAA